MQARLYRFLASRDRVSMKRCRYPILKNLGATHNTWEKSFLFEYNRKDFVQAAKFDYDLIKEKRSIRFLY